MSPHFGLMDTGKMSQVEAARLRGQLHWRGGQRRLRQGKSALGLATLYDALLSGLRWYILANPEAGMAGATETELENDSYVLARAVRAGLFNLPEDALRIRSLAEAALCESIPPSDQEWFVAELERVLTRIKILPFPESALPPEDPDTD